MASKRTAEEPEKFSFSSSIADDVWHPRKPALGYEWWYFDALSDDGKDAVVVIFLDNFIFSPRYNSLCRMEHNKAAADRQKSDNSNQTQSKTPTSSDESVIPQSAVRNPQSAVPALAFIYYHNGKPLYRAVNEFQSADFEADVEKPACRMGENGFKFESAPYGSGYLITINTILPRRHRRIEAKLEWLSIESDFLPGRNLDNTDAAAAERHTWNLVAPRSDVTGSIRVIGENGKPEDVRQFRGTGYHDHNADARWLPAAVRDWQWGRAHFDDATAVYYRYRHLNEGAEPITKLFLIKKNELKVYDAYYEERAARRSIFGLKYPKEIVLSTEEGIRLGVWQNKPIDESFFYLRFLSEAKLKYPSAPDQEAFAITEHLAPKALKYRWLDWLVNMRIGRNGRGSFLP